MLSLRYVSNLKNCGDNTSSITKKNIRFDFDGEIKIRYVRYKHLTEITIKVHTTLLTFTI